tara:strand:+ start:3683 stop:4123 length:441 start_codon:yes stop_codon:yes gene_type:complete
MPSLISDTEKNNLTGIFNDIFDTFKRTITVHKEPKRVVDSVNTASLFGYGDPASSVNYTYVPQSGIYDATIRYNLDQTQETLGDIPQYVSEGAVYIKVQREARDYINKGKTEKITFDNKSFKVISEDANKSFLNSEFFVYKLESTK